MQCLSHMQQISAQKCSAPASNMKGFFNIPADASSRAGRPASGTLAADGSAEQPAASIGSAEQPAIRSIADVDKLLKADASLLRRFEKSKRIEEVVACLRSNPKQNAIEVFFKPWDVQQRIKKDRRPLPELIEELTTKVIKATVKHKWLQVVKHKWLDLCILQKQI